SVIAQWTPSELRDGDWATERDHLADLVVKTMEQHAPGLGELVTARQVTTPVDLERDYALSGGHVYHAEPGLDQFFVLRPPFGPAPDPLRPPRLCLCAVPVRPSGVVPVRLGRAPGRRRHRRPRRERRSRDPERPQEALLEGLDARERSNGVDRVRVAGALVRPVALD